MSATLSITASPVLRNSLAYMVQGNNFLTTRTYRLLRQLCIRVGQDAIGNPLIMVILVTSPPTEVSWK